MAELTAVLVGISLLILAKGDPLGLICGGQKLSKLEPHSALEGDRLRFGSLKLAVPGWAAAVAGKYLNARSPLYIQSLSSSLRLLSDECRMTPVGYIALKLMAITPCVLGAVVLLLADRLNLALISGGMAGTVWLGCDLVLSSRSARRRKRLTHAMPSIIDLLIVCTGSGLSLTKSIELLAEGADPIGKELQDIPKELSAGKSLSEALKSFASKFSIPAVTRFVNSVIQGEVLGTPVSEVLRIQAAEIRTAIRQEMELMAGTIPTKLTLCTIVFLLPSVFAIVVVPNLIAIISSRW